MSDVATSLEVHTGSSITGLRLLGCEGRDAISELFEVRVLLARTEPLSDDDIVTLMTTPCAMAFGQGPGSLMAGVLSDLCKIDTQVGESRYLATMVPTVSLLEHSVVSRAYVSTSIPDIVRDVLGRYGLAEGEQYAFHLLQECRARPFVTQYSESDWAFVSRWLEQYGIFYWFAHEPTGDVLHWADDRTVATPRSAPVALRYAARSGLELGAPTLTDLDRHWRRRPGRVVAGHIDETHPTRMPQLEGRANHPLGFGLVYEFTGPGGADEEEGTRIARSRAERLRQEMSGYRAVTNAPAVRAGVELEVEGSPGPERLRVTATRFAVGYPVDAALARGSLTGEPRPYRAEIEAVDANEQIRPARRTPWPRIHGVVLGYVKGAGGALAAPDDAGRYLVSLPFVTPGASGSSSARIRVAHDTAGVSEWRHTPLRAGTPVLLAFHDGDPDRPFILSALGNATTAPHSRQTSATKTVTHSASGIHIELEDQEGTA